MKLSTRQWSRAFLRANTSDQALRLSLPGNAVGATFGDSHANGVATDTSAALSSACSLPFVDLGVNGETTTQVVARLAQLDAASVRIAVVIMGINDVNTLGPMATFLANYATLLAYTATRNIHVIAVQMFPAQAYDNAKHANRVAWNAALASLVAQYPHAQTINLDSTLGQFRVGGPAGNLYDLQAAYNHDDYHLTVAGTGVFAAAIAALQFPAYLATATGAAVANAVAGMTDAQALNTLRRLNAHNSPPTVIPVDIATCQADGTSTAYETWSASGTGASIADNTAVKIRGTKSLNLVTTGGNSGTFTCLLNSVVSVNSGVVLWLRVNDPTKLNAVLVRLWEDAAGASNHYIRVFRRSTSDVFYLSAADTWYCIHLPAFFWNASTSPVAWYPTNGSKNVRRLTIQVDPEAGQDVTVTVGAAVGLSCSKAIFISRWDDATTGQDTIVAPSLEAAGLRGFFAAQWNNVGTPGKPTAASLGSMARAGHELGCHTYSGATMTGLTDGERRSEIMRCRRQLNAIGVHDKSFVFPGNNGNFDDAAEFMHEYFAISYGEARRAVTQQTPPNWKYNFEPEPTERGWRLPLVDDYHNLPGWSMTHAAGDDGAASVSKITEAILYRGLLTLYGHDVQASPGGSGCNPTAWANILAAVTSAVANGTLWVTTPFEYYTWARAENAKLVVPCEWLL